MLPLLFLSGCAWNPVMTPYAFKGASKVTPGETATIWGVADGRKIYFREINGKGLPSRKGGGYPISLSLLPGNYTIEVLYWNPDLRSALMDLPVSVEAGHTYRIETHVPNGGDRVLVRLVDLGKDVKCRYERYEKISGKAKLICE